jgi:hypothetical protein
MRTATALLLVVLLAPPVCTARGDGGGLLPSDSVRRDRSLQERLSRLSDPELHMEFERLKCRAMYKQLDWVREKDPVKRARLRARVVETEADVELARAELLRRRR